MLNSIRNMKTSEDMKKLTVTSQQQIKASYCFLRFTRYGALWKLDSRMIQYNFTKFYILLDIFSTKVRIELKTKTINRAS